MAATQEARLVLFRLTLGYEVLLEKLDANFVRGEILREPDRIKAK